MALTLFSALAGALTWTALPPSRRTAGYAAPFPSVAVPSEIADQEKQTAAPDLARPDDGAAVRYAGEVPLPLAGEQRDRQRSFVGRILSSVRSLAGFRDPPIEEIYESEARHPEWAPAMEGTLTRRFSRDRLGDLGGVELSAVECRLSTCRVEISHPTALDPAFGGEDRGALNRLMAETGPLAATVAVIEGGERRVQTEGRRVWSMLLIFSGREIDPNEYPRWLQEEQPRWKAMHRP